MNVYCHVNVLLTLRQKKKIAVLPLTRPTLFQTPDSAIFLSEKMQNKKSKASTLNKIPVFS